MNREVRVLVTGAGGIGGVNFVRALRLAEHMEGRRYFIVGTDFNPHHLLLPDVDVRCRTPRHSDPTFIPKLLELIKKHSIIFIHPHPSVEARVVAEHRELLDELGVMYYLPRPEDIAPDKLTMHVKLRSAGVPAPATIEVKSFDDIDAAFQELGSPLWVRAKAGAGGRLSLKVSSPEEAKLWIKLNVMQGRARVSDFIIQEYLPGRDLAFDSLWYEGRLITSYARERLEYPLKHISLTGITGTPTVARTIHDDEVTEVGIKAVKALNPRPHGFYSVDLREDSEGRPKVTEVDGKWHTTAPLWGYAVSKVLKDLKYNLAYLYLKLGLNEEIPPDVPEANLFPKDCYLIRQLDSGVLLRCGNNVWRII